jgi:hypothetical protein
MELLYISSSSPGRKLIHYLHSHDAAWLWCEPFDIGRVPATGSHGTDSYRGEIRRGARKVLKKAAGA